MSYREFQHLAEDQVAQQRIHVIPESTLCTAPPFSVPANLTEATLEPAPHRQGFFPSNAKIGTSDAPLGTLSLFW